MPSFFGAPGSAWAREDDHPPRPAAPAAATPTPAQRPLFADDEADRARDRAPAARATPGRGPSPETPAESTSGHGRSRLRDTGSFLGGFVGTGGHDDDRPDPRSTGPGNGPVPSHWGPDESPDEDSAARRAAWGSPGVEEAPGRSWLRLAAAIAGVVVVVLAIVFAVNLGGSGDSADPGADVSPSAEPSSSAPAPQRVTSPRSRTSTPRATRRRRTRTSPPWPSTASPAPPGRP